MSPPGFFGAPFRMCRAEKARAAAHEADRQSKAKAELGQARIEARFEAEVAKGKLEAAVYAPATSLCTARRDSGAAGPWLSFLFCAGRTVKAHTSREDQLRQRMVSAKKLRTVNVNTLATLTHDELRSAMEGAGLGGLVEPTWRSLARIRDGDVSPEAVSSVAPEVLLACEVLERTPRVLVPRNIPSTVPRAHAGRDERIDV